MSYPRRRKLPMPRLQLRLIGAFAGLTALALILEFALVAARLSDLAARLPSGGEYLVDALPEILLSVAGLSLLVLLPLTVAVGVTITFRWAGPLHRIHLYLNEVIAGRASGPCRVREGDELQELCALINQALAAERERAGQTSEPRELRPPLEPAASEAA